MTHAALLLLWVDIVAPTAAPTVSPEPPPVSALNASSPDAPTAAPTSANAPRLVVERAPGAQGCPDAAALDELVSARVGRAAFSADGARRVVVTLDRVEGGPRARVVLWDADGTQAGGRTLQTTETGCGRMRETLVAFLALALERFASAPPPSPSPPAPPETPPPAPPGPAPSAAEPAPTPTPAATPLPSPAQRPVAAAPAPPRRRWLRPQKPGPRWARPTSTPRVLGVSVHGGFSGAWGVLPSVAPGPVAGAALRVGPVELGAELMGWGPSLRSSRERWWWGAGGVGLVSVCTRAGWWWGCALGGGGGLVQGLWGAPGGGPVVSPAALAGGRWRLELPLWAGLSVVPVVDVTVPLVRTKVRLDGAEAWRTPPLNASGGVWLAWSR